MKRISERFLELGEYYASGLFEEEERSLFYRKALALRRYYENAPVPTYTGEKLYPSGVLPTTGAVIPHYLNGFWADRNELKKKDRELDTLFADSGVMDFYSTVPWQHTVAGNMYTHSMPNYERILAEGLDGYEVRIRKMQDKELREGLLHVIAGIRQYHGRCLQYLESVNAPEELLEGMRKVPFGKAENIYDAVEVWNWALYLDSCDNLGSVASGLLPYWHGEDITDLLDNLYRNLDDNSGYSMSIGAEESPLMLQCLKASRGKRRPMIEFFADDSTPDEVWNEAVDCVLSGNGQPAFYNRKIYREKLRERFPELREEDLGRLCGGGCTEMMVAGLSNVGSLDAGINLLWILEQSMKKDLLKAESFEDFYKKYLDFAHSETLCVLRQIALSQKRRSEQNPLPMRTLLVDDCIEKERDYNNGGARYMWSVVSFAGTVNVIDSLMAIKTVIFDEKRYTAAEFLRKLAENDRAFLREMKDLPKRMGVDDPETNQLAYDLTHTVFGYLREEKPYFGFGFLPASIQFQTYAEAAKHIGATPCGRGSGEPMCDSLAAIFQKDTEGPTAMLRSVSAMDLCAALGTPVVNFTVNPSCDPGVLRGLIEGYMELGGMQLQITCTSREVVREAYENPEAHRNLVVRVGGYSEYFCRLSDALKLKVLERTYNF